MTPLDPILPGIPEVGTNTPIPGNNSTFSSDPGMFNVIIPEPFVLANQDKEDLKKIKEEILDKLRTSENRLAGFYAEHQEYAQSWRVQARTSSSKKPKGLFNSKSGETHRATETLATLFQRMLTAHDPFFEAVAEGLDDYGQELTTEQLYAVEAVLIKQLTKTKFKQELLRGLTSVSLFGTAIFEEPWVSLPFGSNQKSFESTAFVLRSLLQTYFDVSVFDIEMSDFIAFADYVSKWRLMNLSSSDEESWDRNEVGRQIDEFKTGIKNGTGAYNRIIERRNRAGYHATEDNVLELLNYHGRIETENSVVNALWESLGIEGDPKYSDFSVGVLNDEAVVKFHRTPYGSWHNIAKVCHYKLFELEPLGYGVGRLARKNQREIDVTQSRASDILMFALYSMWKVGRFAGLKANQLNIKPWNIVELDDVNQLEQIKTDINAIVQSLAMQGILKEDLRATTGATTNLQAINTKATATEASLTQTEAMRSSGVRAEILGDTLIREHLDTMHLNNCNLLDNEIWAAITGTTKPRALSRHNLPKNVGFKIKTTTDKDFRPERIQKLLEVLQLATSIRNLTPSFLNVIEPVAEEVFRGLGMNPRLLRKPIPMAEQMQMALQRAQATGGGGGGKLGNEVAGEAADEQAGALNMENTPVGPVPTSPLGAMGVPGL